MVKWLLAIVSVPFWMKAWGGIFEREVSTLYGRNDPAEELTGRAALHFGLWNLLYGALCIAAAWAVWYFWQQNEE